MKKIRYYEILKSIQTYFPESSLSKKGEIEIWTKTEKDKDIKIANFGYNPGNDCYELSEIKYNAEQAHMNGKLKDSEETVGKLEEMVAKIEKEFTPGRNVSNSNRPKEIIHYMIFDRE